VFVKELIAAGKTLKEYEHYSFKKPIILGGEYSVIIYDRAA